MLKEENDCDGTGIVNQYYEKTGYLTRTVLIVDDEEFSRNILCHILKDSYDILTAKDGREALDIMTERGKEISLVLLDLMMPVMDGYDFLKAVTANPQLSSIPVIVTTARDREEDEIWSLENGAADFVSKPYHPKVVKRRVDRMIRLRETAAMLNAAEHDRLTGLFSREFFYMETERLLERRPETSFDMVVADVENFKVINERLGVKTGDEVLRHMAERYREVVGDRGICTRLHADVFAMLVEHGDGSWKQQLFWQWNDRVDGIPLQNMVIKYGIYENVSRTIPAFGMCDRAVLALNRIKNLYGRYVSVYNSSFSDDLFREQQILDSMEQALAEHQFQVYYQPKYDINRECISGAEALVRWVHPRFGFMTPNQFLALFERNGFITKLDYYVCEEVCRTLQRWRQEGRDLVPVSVNFSRADFAVTDLVERITELTDTYGIDRGLLHLEITESVYTDKPHQIIDTVKKLQEHGFRIELDDFGSGYSSLNMFSDLPMDILKLDMKFVQKNYSNSKNILGYIISLSEWMNLETIAEGVETREQVERLKSFGCDYAQGYYYARPMPEEDFERFLKEAQRKSCLLEKHAAGSTVPGGGECTDTVLIVDDNTMNREILRSMLEDIYCVRDVSNGEEACAYLREHPGEISVILLDMVMPVMDGFQFMKRRENDSELSRIPVIITSEPGKDSELVALRIGADRFMGKPYRTELVRLSVKSVLRNKN